MSIVHHPDEAVLLAYASGAADEPTALIVATHLALCAACRRAVREGEAAGGALLDEVAPQAVDVGGLGKMLARLDTQDHPAPAPRAQGVTPEPLRTYLGGEVTDVRWRRITAGLSDYRIMQKGRTVARLIKAMPGAAVAEHTHTGEELTLILTGGLTDHTGQYHRGDVQTAASDILHKPTALPGEPCIVLAVTDAPLRFKSPVMAAFARLLRF